MVRSDYTDDIERPDTADVELLGTYYSRIGKEYLSELKIEYISTAVAMNMLFEKTVFERYLKPTLQHVRMCGVETAAEHARRIGVERSTTNSWWNLDPDKRREGKPAAKRANAPNLKTFLYTLAGFDVNAGDVFPEGQYVANLAWIACVTFFARQFLKWTMTEEIRLDELVCLHLVWNSAAWKEAVMSKQDDKLRKAAEPILETIYSICKSALIVDFPDIQSVLEKWFKPGTMVFSMLNTNWTVE